MVSLDYLLQLAGEPTRLRLLNLLTQGSICVCDLQALLGVPQSTISRHLAALRHADLVKDTRCGARVVYSLAAPATPQMEAFCQFLEKCRPFEQVLQDDLRALEEAHRTGALWTGGETAPKTGANTEEKHENQDATLQL